MTVLRDTHADYGATFTEVAGRAVPAHYGRAERTHLAVRNAVGATEHAHGVLVVEGEDRHEFVDNAVSNAVPDVDGEGRYALLLDPQGGVRADLYVFCASDRLLVFTPLSMDDDLAAEWREKVFIDDVEVTVATDDFAVLGVYGPNSTEKVASVLHGATPPDVPLSFVRGELGDAGVTVVRDDGLTGEEGYLVVCAAADAPDVFDALVTRGLNAVPFGRRVWEALTLEAGTPLFETEIEGVVPNVLGLRNALDFSKGCYVGQEVVSRVENQGRPSRRLVGLAVDALPAAGAAVFDGDRSVGEVTRAARSRVLDAPIALAVVDFEWGSERVERANGDAREDGAGGDATVRVDGDEVGAAVERLPFVEGSDRSARLPEY